MGAICVKSPLALVEDEDELEDQADDMFQTEKKGRLMVRAIHPETGELLRGQLIRRNVPFPPEEQVRRTEERKIMIERLKKDRAMKFTDHADDSLINEHEALDDYDIMPPDEGFEHETHYGHMIRWGRYWMKEPASDMIVEKYDSCEASDIPQRFNQYIDFVQTVGSPGHDYKQGEIVYLVDRIGQVHRARISAKEENYYYVVPEKKSSDRVEMPGEWIHRYSTRLRKLGLFEGREEKPDLWGTIYELDWVRAFHPSTREYEPAKVVNKVDKEQKMARRDYPSVNEELTADGIQCKAGELFEVLVAEDRGCAVVKNAEGQVGRIPLMVLTQTSETRHLILQYHDSKLLVKQQKITYEELDKNNSLIENYTKWKARWRYNRVFIYEHALLSVGLIIHPMIEDDSHSLFRALSHQLHGTDSNHIYLRVQTLDHIASNKEYFSRFVDVNFEYYVAHKRKGVEGQYFSMGDHLDIQAICELYDCRVKIYSELSERPLDAIQFYSEFEFLPVLLLSYRGNNHYDSLVNEKSQVPVTVERDLRLVPLGSHKTTRFLVKRAREAQFRKALADLQIEDALASQEVIVCCVMGSIEFPAGMEETLLKQLLDIIGLPLPVPKVQGRRDNHSNYPFYHDSNPNIIMYYPSLPQLDSSLPTIRFEGVKKLVDKAVNFLTEHCPGKNSLREVSVGSRMAKQVHITGKAKRQQFAEVAARASRPRLAGTKRIPAFQSVSEIV